jgi:hypothetical protein
MGNTNKIKLEVEKSFSSEDSTEILRLCKVATTTQGDIDSIFHLYKKYISPGTTTYSTTCNCSTSITKYWMDLKELYFKKP